LLHFIGFSPYHFEVYFISELIKAGNILREVGGVKAPDVYWLKPIKPCKNFTS
jgi:hypothetical protein